MAFLHRVSTPLNTSVVNGGGTLEREYAIGRDAFGGQSQRMDLCLKYGKITLGIELKAWRDKRGNPMDSGLNTCR